MLSDIKYHYQRTCSARSLDESLSRICKYSREGRTPSGDSLIKLFPAILDMITGTKTSHHDLNIVGYRCATFAFTKGC